LSSQHQLLLLAAFTSQPPSQLQEEQEEAAAQAWGVEVSKKTNATKLSEVRETPLNVVPVLSRRYLELQCNLR
jgi:hypothetical protein